MLGEWNGTAGGIRWAVRQLGQTIDAAVVRGAIAGVPNGLLLESVAPHATYGRYSYYAIGDPIACQMPNEASSDPLMWPHFLRCAAGERLESPIPFVGGWIGFLSYEFGQYVEPISRRHEGMEGVPLAMWWWVDAVLAHDRETSAWYAAACAKSAFADTSEAMSRAEGLAALCPTRRPTHTAACEQVESNLSPSAYAMRVERALEYIRAGDIYQVNLAQRFRVQSTSDAGVLYENLCASNPAMFAACLAWSGEGGGAKGRPNAGAILSSSPELFVHVDDGRIITRPIKGTRRRTGIASADSAAILELETAEKDAAELVMIVDLERNDLGRLCEYGSVRVTCAAETEAHPTVFHRVATIDGRLRKNTTVADILRATFPGGSITGAPKVRAMQIIDELEPHPRGPYCGCIGYIGINGGVMLNLAIRTMCLTGQALYWWAGGGIVADSDPAAEYDESLAKADGMRHACGGIGTNAKV